MTDPERRDDGICARDECSKPVVMPKHHPAAISSRVYEQEAFCSTDCCRIFYGLDAAKPREFRARNQLCAGCECSLDVFTAGCRHCYNRRYRREQTKASAA